MRPASLSLLFIAAVPLAPAAAQGAPRAVHFDVPAGPLSSSLPILAEQARITIAATDPHLGTVRAPTVRGTMPLATALRRLLRGSGYDFILAGPDAVRIVRSLVPSTGQRRPTRAGPKAIPFVEPEIVVTASKQATPLGSFPGTAHVLTLTQTESDRYGGRGSEELLDQLPMLAATNLGPGRNKLFIRGIADSSFNGVSQSVSGEYLGDVRLTFSAPDPDLRLFDVARVEVLEGPQGTLYGSGALGGIFRIVPNGVNLAGWSGDAVAGLSATSNGAPGRDAAFALNAPIVGDRIGVRLAAYSVVEGGYINDLERGLNNVNRTSIAGGRATFVVRPAGSSWEFETGGIAQFLEVRDGQYAEAGLPPLARRSAIAQPFDNDYALAQFTVRRPWAGLELVSTNEFIHHALDSQFDATGFAGTSGPQAYVEHSAIAMLANETRISRSRRDGTGWIAGFSFVHNVDTVQRSLGPPGSRSSRIGVRNAVDEAAAFGQLALAPSSNVIATAGARLTYSVTAGNPVGVPDPEALEPVRRDTQISPTLGLSWRPAARLMVFARYQEGFRAGGLAIGPTRASAHHFVSDELASTEVGVRFGNPQSRLSFAATASHARWTNMQADFVDERGIPSTANIGDGRIDGLEASLVWRPTQVLRIDGAAFLDNSSLANPDRDAHAGDLRNLPNIAEAGARAGVEWHKPIAPTVDLQLDGSLRYVGKSQLGIGPPLDVVQGDYVRIDAGAQLSFPHYTLSLDASNLTNVKGNSFAFGNPFLLTQRNQTTPLRPMTVRLGLAAHF